MTKPYYLDDYVTIYHGDCREILPEIPKMDLVLTDPPYANLSNGFTMPASKTGVAKGSEYQVVDSHLWDSSLGWLLPAWGLVNYGMIVFCSFHSVPEIALGLPSAKRIALVCWYERNSPGSVRNRPHYMTQYIWLLEKNTGLDWRNLRTHYDIPKLAAGCFASERIIGRDGSTSYPTQKPISLLMEILKVNPQTILDPFLGSGTTAVAAKKLNRKCIGIEIEERYCEIAANRCRQMVMELGI